MTDPHTPDAPRPGGATAWRPEAQTQPQPQPPLQPQPIQADYQPQRQQPYPQQPMQQHPAPPQHYVPQYAQAPAGLGPGAPNEVRVAREQWGAFTALPVEERSYPVFLRAPRWRWWKPLLALIATALLAAIAMTVPALLGMFADGTDIMQAAASGQLELGPWGFLGNNVGIALCIPIAMVMQWAFFGQRPRWLSSVEGRFRWGWFFRCCAVIVPIWLVMMGIEFALSGLPELKWRPYTVLLIVGILLTTPFQAAGEEYLMRGLQTKIVASYFKRETLGWAIAAVVSSLSFMWLHSAADPWLNVFYFSFGMVSSFIAWKTGGLEAAVAIHVVNNMLSEALMPWSDISKMFDRSAGVADASILIQVGVLLGAGGALWWLSRRMKLADRSAPGRAELLAAQAQIEASWQNAGQSWWAAQGAPAAPAPQQWQPPTNH